MQKKVKDGFNNKLGLALKSGKYSLGFRSTLRSLRAGKTQIVILASNTPTVRRSLLEYYVFLGGSKIHFFPGSNIDLGAACGKMFRVGCLSITDCGDSDLLDFLKEREQREAADKKKK